MNTSFLRFFLALPLISLLFPVDGWSQRFQVGVRPTVVTAEGVPANDMLSLGIFARIRLSDRWLVGGAIDKSEYDFELPWRVVGLEQQGGLEPVDATVTATIISGWIEREYGPISSPWKLFWTAGAGVTSPDVRNATGPVAGGTFDIETDAGTEVLALASAGVRRTLGAHLAAEFALQLDHHIADWKVRDRVSGSTGSTGDYTALGGHVGLAWRF